MDYEKALKEGKLDERMAYAWLKSDPTAQSKLAKYAREQGKDSIYDIFPGKRGETVVSAPETDLFYDTQAFLNQTGLPVDHPGQRPNQISPGSRMSLADLENQYGSLDLEQPSDMPEKTVVPAESLKSESIKPDYSDPKKADEPKTLIEPAAPAAAGQAQAARPNLDQPDGATSAAALAAAQAMPDFVNRLGGNARWANQAKAQMMQEAKRRQQNEIADLKKSEKAAKRAGEVDEILNTNNDRYRQLYANTPDAEGNKRSAEDWDAMSRDQKIKLIKNYNINMGRKSLESPDGTANRQQKTAAVRPDGSSVSQSYFDKYFNNPNVPDFGNIADKPPAGMAPVYGPEGKIGYRSRSEVAEAAKKYAKNSMRNNARSTTGNVFSGDMEKLFPSLPVNRFKEEVDFDETEKQKKYNPFA